MPPLKFTCPGAVLGICNPTGMLWSSAGCRLHDVGGLFDDCVVQRDNNSHIHSQCYIVLCNVLHSIMLY